MKHFEHPLKHKPSELLWRMMLAFSVFLFACGLVLSPWDTLLPGLAAIHRSPDVLISDYFVIGGMGAAMLNAGLMTLASLLLTRRLGLTERGCHSHHGWICAVRQKSGELPAHPVRQLVLRPLSEGKVEQVYRHRAVLHLSGTLCVLPL